jgi:hypothetical protein
MPRKITTSLFTEAEKPILKFIWKHKRPIIAKAILSKEISAIGVKISDFKLHFRAIVTKRAW